MTQHLSDSSVGREAAMLNPSPSERRRCKRAQDASATVSPEIQAGIEAVVKRLYIDPNAESFSIEAFCARYGVGRQLAYDEVNAGRLVIKKAGRRTLIGRADAERWLERLPGKPAASGAPAIAGDAAARTSSH
jgi:hypothetical protein